MNASLPLGKTFFAAMFGLMLSACGPDSNADSGLDKTGDPDGTPRLVYDVDTIEIAVMESFPLQLRISANGRTRTGGWSEPALVLDEEASEGIRLVYRFEAVPPSGMATQAITPITGSATYGPWVDRAAREITVVAETNSETIMFPNADGE